MNGFFVVIEGVDGSGKSTQAARLSVALTERGHRVFATAEPTGGPVGVLIRERLRGRVELDTTALPYLFAADRADHVARGIGPALGRGEVVVCDRYTLSNVVYRAAETEGPLYACGACDWTGEVAVGDGACEHRGFKPVSFALAVLDRARWARDLSATVLVPDLTIVLTVSAGVARERLVQRNPARRELYEDDAMLVRCAALYHRADELVGGDGLYILDGEDHPDDVATSVLDVVLATLAEKQIEEATKP